MQKEPKRSVLILGAGNAQIDFIKYCKEYGIETYGCSYSDTDPGIPLFDHFEQINIVDQEGILRYFTEEDIDQIYSVGSDISIPTIRSTSISCGKKTFISDKAATYCCDKSRMRHFLKDTPYALAYLMIESEEDARSEETKIFMEQMQFPLIMKPTDSQGQRGIHKLYSVEDFYRNMEDSFHFSRKKQIIVEEYLQGKEISVNVYMKEGEILFFLMSDRESFSEFPGGIIKAHHLPSIYENTPVKENVYNLVAFLVKSLEISDGPVYFQIMIRQEKPYLIEVTPRLDGCHLWRLIEAYCGVNLLEMTMHHLLDQEQALDACLKKKRIPHSGMTLHFICQPPGTSFSSAGQKKEEGEIYRQYYYADGQKVKAINGFMEKCGYTIFTKD